MKHRCHHVARVHVTRIPPSEPIRGVMSDEITDLIQSLDTSDLKEQRRISDGIFSYGDSALPLLIEAIRSSSPSIRKSASYLLGHFKASPEAVPSLCEALLNDPEPKVRQNAAVSLGKTASAEAVDALTQAFEKETFSYVRPSILLALGAIADDAACNTLRSVVPNTDAERDALRKAGPLPATSP
jgi:hypothetical protein